MRQFIKLTDRHNNPVVLPVYDIGCVVSSTSGTTICLNKKEGEAEFHVKESPDQIFAILKGHTPIGYVHGSPYEDEE